MSHFETFFCPEVLIRKSIYNKDKSRKILKVAILKYQKKIKNYDNQIKQKILNEF